MSDLVTVAPAHFLGQCPDLTVLEPPFAIDGHQKVMAWHAKSLYDPVQMWFRHVMKDVAGKVRGFQTTQPLILCLRFGGRFINGV